MVRVRAEPKSLIPPTWMWPRISTGGKRFSLIGRVHLENRLTDILGVKADLADRKMLLPEVLERAERESVLVF